MFALLTKALGSLTSARTPAPKAAPNFRARPQLEGLEDRMVMSATIVNGDLYVYGNNAANTVTVNYQTYSGVGYYKVTENGANSFFRASNVWGGDVAFYGYNGNDYFNNNTGLRTFAYGMGGNDTLLGSWNNDVLDGGSGNDRLYGYGGNDRLYAGADYYYNTNTLVGGDGHDSLYGNYGNDYLYGQNGNDYLAGYGGHDSLYGGYGYDTLYGGYGNDLLNGGDDGVRDYMHGGPGADKFQIDWYWTGSRWANRDAPADYSYYSGDRTYN